MIFKENEMDKVIDCINDQAHKFIRLENAEGKIVVPFNSSRKERIEHFQEKFSPFLTSSTTSAGLYSIVGKHTGKGEFLILCQVDKTNGSEAPKQNPVFRPMSETPSFLLSQKANANYQYIEENARLRADKDILEYQLDEAENRIDILQARIEELELELAESDTKEKPLLSENAQVLLEFAKPFLPMAQALGMNLLAKYMPQPQPQPEQEPQYNQPVNNANS